MGRTKGKDIAGMRSGLVTALEPTEKRRKGSIIWRCRCDCGKELFLEAYKITHGRVESCGCLRGEKCRKDLTGRRFGKLCALYPLEEKRGGKYLWQCRCDCGREVKVTVNALLSGNTKSCGCGRAEALRQTMQTHGTVVEHVHLIDGTYVEKIKRRGLQRNNTSGYTGVQARGNKWIALITFKGKVYYLGIYDKIEDAARARQKAEEQLFGAFLEWYEREFPPRGTAGCPADSRAKAE